MLKYTLICENYVSAYLEINTQREAVLSTTYNLTPTYTPKGHENICPHKNLYTHIHNITIYNSQKWKQPKCPPTDERINKMWPVSTMQLLFGDKKK